MPDYSFTRKLAAILSADVEGYSRPMSLDEADTVVPLKAYRAIISRLISSHNGRVVDSPGDNLLAEFVSVVDAVQCALEIQDELKTNNEVLPADRQMVFRIGINLGDVFEDGGRIHGDGVNIAARIEGLATGGGICISGSTYEQIQNRVSLGCELIGRQSVKNISTPVPVYRIWNDPHANSCSVAPAVRSKPKRSYLTAAFVVALVLTAAAAIVVYQVNAQLIDTATGNHIWADRYNRQIENVFDLQDEIVETAVRKLAVKVNQSERAAAMRKGTDNLKA